MKDHETQLETLKLLADSLRNGLTLIEELMKAPEDEPVQEEMSFTEPEEAPETKMPKRLTPMRAEHFTKGGIRKGYKIPTPADVASAAAQSATVKEGDKCYAALSEVYAMVRKELNEQGMNVPNRKGIRYSLHLHGVPIVKKRYCGTSTNVVDLTDLVF